MENSSRSAGVAAPAADARSVDYDHIQWRDLNLNALYPLTMGFMLSVNVLTYPLNLIKTRMQAPASQLATAPAAPSAVAAAASSTAVRLPPPAAQSTLQQLRSIMASDGVRGLYHGFSLRLGGVLISPIYLTTLETTRQALTEAWGAPADAQPPPSAPASPSSSSPPSSPLSSPGVSSFVSSPASPSSSLVFLAPSIPFLSGLSAALVSQCLFVPLDVLMQHKQVSRQRRSVWQTTQELVRREGLGSLWRGYALAIMYFAPFTTIMWGSYAHLHAALRRRFALVAPSPAPASSLPAAGSPLPPPPPAPRNKWTGFERELVMVPVAGSLSSLLAALLCHPLDVLKTRWQLWDTAAQRQPPSFSAVLQQLKQERGLASGLWVGLSAKLMGVAPTSAMAMTCYELAKRLSLREEAEQRLQLATQYN